MEKKVVVIKADESIEISVYENHDGTFIAELMAGDGTIMRKYSIETLKEAKERAKKLEAIYLKNKGVRK